ncbi:MAG: efflux RND transporter periplasmic adaptor subunit [Acetobacteraceae bacterium]|jgi:RND family efflux transporter MFP subunit
MRRRFIPLLVVLAGLTVAVAEAAETSFTVQRTAFTDEKAVFATVESPNVVPARARIGGTVSGLSVRQGDKVTQGQVIAVVADEKLLLQVSSLDAQIVGLQSQLAQAQTDLARAETLFHQGAGPRTTLDQAHTAVEVASSALRSRTAERAVAQQNLEEGQVLAPVAGRVITVPLTRGTVVLNGDTIATVGEEPFILRLRVPERHAVSLKVDDSVRIDPGQLGIAQSTSGVITLIYPQIMQGRVVADTKVADLGNYFVGDRILVWISAGVRQGYVVPESFLRTHFGLDYVSLRRPDGSVVETPVQRGQPRPTAALPNGVEVLSGVHTGDVLVQP